MSKEVNCCRRCRRECSHNPGNCKRCCNCRCYNMNNGYYNPYAYGYYNPYSYYGAYGFNNLLLPFILF